MSATKRGVLKAAGIITILTLLSRLAGLVRKLAQSWAMSDGAVATAYDTANTVPNVLFEIAAGGALAGAVIPLISGFLARSLRKEASQTASALLSWVLLIGVPVAVIVAATAGPISIALFGRDADFGILNLATVLLRIFAIQIPLYGLSVVFTGVLQAHKKFVLPALSPLLNSIIVIVVFLVYSAAYSPDVDPAHLTWGSVLLLGLGTTAGVIVFSLPQLIPVMRLIDIRLTLHFPQGVARRAIKLAGAGLGALVAQQIAIIAIMIAANKLGGVGAYTTFNYAWAMFMVPYAVLAVPIATATFPQISAAVASARALKGDAVASETNDRQNLGEADSSASRILLEQDLTVSNLIAQSTRLVVAMGIAAAAMLIVLSQPAQIVLEMGRPIEGLSTALIAMGVGAAGYSVMYHGARVLYALERGSWVIMSNTVGWGAVVVGLIIAALSGATGRIASVTAIGISISVGLTIGAVLVLGAIGSVAGRGALAGLARTAVVAVAFEALAAIPAWFAVQWLINVIGANFVGAVLAALAGGILLVCGAALALWCCDRAALRALR